MLRNSLKHIQNDETKLACLKTDNVFAKWLVTEVNTIQRPTHWSWTTELLESDI